MNRHACFGKYGIESDDECGCCNVPSKRVGFTARAKKAVVKCGIVFRGKE